MNWLCIVILAIPVLNIFSGIQKGMVRTAVSVGSVIVTLILGTVMDPYVREFLIEKTPVYDTIREKCEESISESLEIQLNQHTSKEEQEELIESLPLPESMIRVLIKNNNTEVYNHLLAQSFGEYLSYSIAQIAIGIISLTLTFILVSIVMNILGGLLEGIFSLPVLSLINRAGGAVLGAVQGTFVVWFIFLVITLFWDAAWAKTAAAMVRENNITAFLYDNNILVNFLSGILK